MKEEKGKRKKEYYMNNPAKDKSLSFGVQIVKLAQKLQTEEKEYVVSRQILKSGTSIGANIRESQNAQSKADFVSKLTIAIKEADEPNIGWS